MNTDIHLCDDACMAYVSSEIPLICKSVTYPVNHSCPCYNYKVYHLSKKIAKLRVYVILIPHTRVLCLIYAHKPEGCRPKGTCMYIRQSMCLWYKCYVPHYPCKLIALQYKVEITIRPLGKIRLWACTCKQEPPLYLRLSTKMGESYGKRGEFL